MTEETGPMMRLISLIALTLALLCPTGPGMAQNHASFSPRVFVNSEVVTNFEYDQRFLMLTIFNSPGDREAETLQGLIDDRLRMHAAKQLGLSVTPDAISAGMTDFASRANLSAEDFIKALAKAGVAEESFRDFVESGLLWREVVRNRFGPRAAVTEDAIDVALASNSLRGSVRVEVSELVIAVQPGNESQSLVLAQRLRREIRSPEAFADAARTYSSAPSAARGGALGSRQASTFPPEAVSAILSLAPGQVSRPVKAPGTVTLYFLTALQQGPVAEAAIGIDYALLALPADRDPATEAARVHAAVDNCDGLYGLALGKPAEQLVRQTLPASQIAPDIAAELARLDNGEGTLVNRGGQPQYLMLCSRTPISDTPPSRDVVRDELINQRLAAFADGYLEDLRSSAIIRQP